MDFLKTIKNHSEILKQEVTNNNRVSFITFASDGEAVVCEGAGNPNKIARMILDVLARDKSLQQAFKEEVNASKKKPNVKVVVVQNMDDLKAAIDEIKYSL